MMKETVLLFFQKIIYIFMVLLIEDLIFVLLLAVAFARTG